MSFVFIVSFAFMCVMCVVFAVKPQFEEWAVPSEPVEVPSHSFGVPIIVSALSVYLSLAVAKLMSILVDMWFDRHDEQARVIVAQLAREDAAANAAGRAPRPPISR
ncbi:MAG: hypothetical protein WCI22_03690 [Actinomycetota bacterium]